MLQNVLGTLAATFMFFSFVVPVLTFTANLRRRRSLRPGRLYLLTALKGFLLAVAAAWMADC